jgi:putative ABC transport system ATP-binding protein
MAEVRISGLDFRYPGDRAFGLSVANLHVEAGSCTAIVGPSGSGKTTLLNLVAGTLLPDKGTIHVGVNCINQLGETARRRFRIREIGQVFQAFELLEYLTATENILLGAIIDSSVTDLMRERAAELLESVGLGNEAHTRPARLSHGERQRVAVCRAMLNRPALLLADEPTGNLDQANKQNVVDLLIKQAHDHGSTLLMVTHDRSLLDSFDHVVDFEQLTGAVP